MNRPVPPPPKKPPIALRPVQKKTAEVSLASRKTIDELMRRSRAPFIHYAKRHASPDELDAIEKDLRDLERQLLDRELAVQKLEADLADRERDLWEGEALLAAKEKLLAERMASPISVAPEGMPVSAASDASLLAVSMEIERQEQALLQLREEIKQREAFIDEAESRLFEKTLEQQQREAEIEQREEELNAMLAAAHNREAASSGE